MAAAIAALIGTGAAAGCTSENAQVSCAGDACTVTFDRNANSEVTVLGIRAKLVSVQNNQAVVQIANQTVTVPVGQKVDILNGTFQVEVQQITQDKVVVRINRTPGQ